MRDRIITSGALAHVDGYGIDAQLIDVEVDMYSGRARDLITVGMPDTAVRASRERIKSAALEFRFRVSQQVGNNPAPANVREEGAGGFDLPMALGILGAMGVAGASDDNLFVGELSLGGSVGGRRCECVRDAPPVRGRAVSGVPGGIRSGEAGMVGPLNEVSAAGAHNVLMIGPPESGKTVLARRLAGILPLMTFAEALQTTQVHSVAGLLSPGLYRWASGYFWTDCATVGRNVDSSEEFVIARPFLSLGAFT